jgi:restriction endonuclease S subunit
MSAPKINTLHNLLTKKGDKIAIDTKIELEKKFDIVDVMIKVTSITWAKFVDIHTDKIDETSKEGLFPHTFYDYWNNMSTYDVDEKQYNKIYDVELNFSFIIIMTDSIATNKKKQGSNPNNPENHLSLLRCLI